MLRLVLNLSPRLSIPPPMFALFKQTNPAPYPAAPGRNRLVKPILGRPGPNPRPQERRTPGLPLPRQLVPRPRPQATPSRLHTPPVIPFPNSCLHFPLTRSSLLLHLISYFWLFSFDPSRLMIETLFAGQPGSLSGESQNQCEPRSGVAETTSSRTTDGNHFLKRSSRRERSRVDM